MSAIRSHELARRLLAMPDLPVFTSDDSYVVSASEDKYDTASEIDLDCICLELEDGY